MEKSIAIDFSTAIVSQPRLASQEDISDESIQAVPPHNYLQDPMFEPLKNARQLCIQQVLDYVDIDDEDSISIKYEIRNKRDNSIFFVKKTIGELTDASCHDNYRACQLSIETPEGQNVVNLEGVPGYSGFACMKVFYGRQCVGKINQNYDTCSICNPQYSVLNSESEKILQISVLNAGFCCGLSSVESFLIISGNLESAIGHIDCHTSRPRPWSRKLMADERRPLENFKVTFPEDLDLEAKLLLVAATFTVISTFTGIFWIILDTF